MDFAQRYGPWAVLAGASEGIGAAFAHALAGRGLHLVLLARRRDKLEAFAEQVRAQHGVEVRTHALDLGDDDVERQVAEASAELDVGLLVYNACYAPIGAFLDISRDDKEKALAVNCRGPLLLTTHFGERLTARGRGGIVLMSSMSGFVGTAMVGTYAATKAFNTVLGETLWEELGARGVDVLVCAAGATETPGFLATTPVERRRGAFPLPPAVVVEEALEALGAGNPTLVPGRFNRLALGLLSRLLPRGTAVRIMSKNTRKLYT